MVTFSLFSVDDLAAFLVLPTRGKQLISPLEFWSYKFELRREVTNRSFDSLDDSLKLLHYYITRVYFPRADRLDVVLPLDCWVMSHAISDMSLSYPHLLFGAIVDASANDSPGVGLPFAGLITLLLHRLGVPLADFVTISDGCVHPSIDEVLAVVGLPPIVDLSSGGADHGATDAAIRERDEEDEASADGGALLRLLFVPSSSSDRLKDLVLLTELSSVSIIKKLLKEWFSMRIMISSKTIKSLNLGGA
ncbi:unnamed protein product [Linum tenue]|uniref:Uncharacterized protein n=1 Tax=Linum tenue TaxID=586396 RepID=A0AAV0HEL4_9ROSI|nr:unnamed protein product [Linum tenue]